MKKLFTYAIVIFVLSIITLTGCGKEKTAETGAFENEQTKEPAEETEIPAETEVPARKIKDIPDIKGIYISGNMAGSPRFESRLDLILTTELNGIVIDVKDEWGNITFKNKFTRCDELGLVENKIADIDGLLARLKEAEIYTIARINCFKDMDIADVRPDFVITTPEGKPYRENRKEDAHTWMNPYNRDVWEYLAYIAIETAKMGFDEIQLDYVRFPTDKQMNDIEFSEEETGGLSRTEIMVEFAKYIMEALAPYDVVVAADLFATIIISEVDAQLIGQDYAELAKIYDVLCPMAYPNHYHDGTLGVENPDMQPYDILLKTFEVSNQKLQAAGEEEGCHIAKIRPWVWDGTASWLKSQGRKYQTYTGKQMQEQFDALSDNGINGWLIWDSINEYNGYRDLVGQPYE